MKSFKRYYRSTGQSNGPPVVSDGTVYAASDTSIHALDVGDGTVHWQTDVAGVGMLAVGDGVLYGFGFDTPLFALETSEEEVLWRYGGRMTTPPALADDYLFVGSETGTVHAIGPGSK